MNLDFDFFNIANNKVVENGRVLISEPFLSDNYFRRSVVYLTEHSDTATVGFVLNKALNMKISEVLDDFPRIDFQVSLGGPVSTNTIHYLHTLGDSIPESVHVKDGIFWGGDFEVMKSLVRSGEVKNDQLRFFLGYSGWGEKQLEGELELNAWLVGDIPSGLVMKGGSAEFWTDILSNLDAKYKAWANFPDDPGLN
ncbi:MAG: YqgE/AlgH family protein [Bacteroidales bacterium]|nr:YqgE/AlgH family protein [Bacteroidales bacterium]